jgi:hypothetical protein
VLAVNCYEVLVTVALSTTLYTLYPVTATSVEAFHDKFVVVVVVPEADKVDGADGAVVSAAPAVIFTV